MSRVQRFVPLSFVVLGILSFLFPDFPLLAQTKHTPSLDELLSMKSVSSPQISPDGKFVAYSVQETDWKDNAYVSQIWLADVESGATIQLTRGKKSSENPQWSPDGKWVAFASEREIIPPITGPSDDKSETKPAARQIWLISPSGGEAWVLTRHETNVGGFRWSSNGRQIAFTATEAESKAMKDRKEKYSDYEVFEEDFTLNQLWVVDVSEAEASFAPVKARQVTKDPTLNIGGFAWSPDSIRIAFQATPNPLLAFSGEADLYLVDLARENQVHRIVALEGPDGNPVFSPDGKQLAFSTALGQKYSYYLNGHIATVNLEMALTHPATKPSDVNDLTAEFDENPQLMNWGPDGIYFGALQKTSSHLFRIEPQTRQITRISSPDRFAGGGTSFTRDFKRVAFTASDDTHVGEIFVSTVAPFAPRKLTDLNKQLKGWTVGSVELISWKSKDGSTIEGVLHKPADFDPHKKYPLLVVIHGGPTGISRALMNPANHYYPVEQFLSKGALVLEPNYRGSAGYGEKFRSLNVRNLGVGDMWDVMSGVDAVIAQGIVDPSRLGSMGWSQGGYISAFLTTNTDRFKAISVGAGISDWMTYYVNTDITPFTRQYLHATPWEDPAIYALTSPITNIRKARTPTLIQHGQFDKRVPNPNGFELYRGLKDENVPARMIIYAGFGHGITKPKSNRAVLQHNLDWFSYYIWGEPVPPESPLRGSGEAVTHMQ
ncbi:MAG: S9 family peptidase [Acidobacteriia bacterium]|nr:S9 family peptidase [Terriglobia bacterium]